MFSISVSRKAAEDTKRLCEVLQLLYPCMAFMLILRLVNQKLEKRVQTRSIWKVCVYFFYFFPLKHLWLCDSHVLFLFGCRGPVPLDRKWNPEWKECAGKHDSLGPHLLIDFFCRGALSTRSASLRKWAPQDDDNDKNNNLKHPHPPPPHYLVLTFIWS